MPINVNGTTINDVKVNGVSMNEVKVNGVIVWTRNLDLNLLNDAASAYIVTTTGSYVSRSFTKNASGQFVFSMKNREYAQTLNVYVTRNATIDFTKYSKLNIAGYISSNGAHLVIKILDANKNVLENYWHIGDATGSFNSSLDISKYNQQCYIQLYEWSNVANEYITATISTFQLII